ncbi:hypothetical protein NKH36_20300 [Mesorhizobium sp. M1312]|uniref:hypothetical protein n=1 Tax=unclassified Mesorhizobium TaxID=325217 RepID=UPI003338107D
MTAIYDVKSGCILKGRSVLLDTNVWISLEGIDPHRSAGVGYSEFFAELRKSDNSIVINDYILGEFFNRVCKIEYDIRKNEFTSTSSSGTFPSYKKLRKSAEFSEFMTGVT